MFGPEEYNYISRQMTLLVKPSKSVTFPGGDRMNCGDVERLPFPGIFHAAGIALKLVLTTIVERLQRSVLKNVMTLVDR